MSDTAVHEILTWIADHGWRLFWAFLFIAGARSSSWTVKR
jgi:hypothetical protein